jgi:hypothetical protein
VSALPLPCQSLRGDKRAAKHMVFQQLQRVCSPFCRGPQELRALYMPLSVQQLPVLQARPLKKFVGYPTRLSAICLLEWAYACTKKLISIPPKALSYPRRSGAKHYQVRIKQPNATIHMSSAPTIGCTSFRACQSVLNPTSMLRWRSKKEKKRK